MPAVTGAVPNLINGISQQPPDMRLASQAAASTNFYPVISTGLTPRPRTDHLGLIAEALDADAFTHVILRDNDEKYLVAITPDLAVRVWDLADGTEKTVTNNGTAYLEDVTSPRTELVALTVADHTFIVNKSVVVAAGSTTADARPHEALVDVIAGQYGKTYRVKIDDTVRASLIMPNGGDASHSPYVDTVRIADALFQRLDDGTLVTGYTSEDAGGETPVNETGGYSTSPWTLGRYHSTLYLANSTTDFDITAEDGYAGKAMKAVKGKVQKFSDLPVYGPDGIVMEVAGDENTEFDNYWVKFQDQDGAQGLWVETIAPGTVLGLDADTMPHTLVRNEDGTFTFGPATWSERTCGDADKNPDPSFVGQTISGVFYHRNRLGFLTEENYVLSAAGEPFNFFRSTMLTLLDTDPIDGNASHIKVSLFKHAVPYSEELLLFTENTQFRLAGNDLLTPKTVNSRPLSELGSSAAIAPVVAGSGVYFLAEGASYASLFEFYYDQSIKQADDEEVSSHVPSYIPAGVHTLVASPDLNVAAIATSGDTDAIYLYKWHWRGQEKVQSAWCKWELPGATRIMDLEFDKKRLVVVVVRGSTTCIERMDLEPGALDTGLTYRIGLDRSVVLSNGTYDSDTDKTTFTLPYVPVTGLKAVTSAEGDEYPAGVELTPTLGDDEDVTIDGDLSGESVRFGYEYTARHRLSPLYPRDSQGQTSGGGRTQVLTLTLFYANSAYFRVEVTPFGRAKRKYPFSAQIAGSAVTGAISLANGRLSVPIRSRNDRVVVELVNDTWRPCAFTKASWKGTYAPNNEET